MDAEKLITAIQTRVPLWDQKSKQYHDRDVCDKLWTEVAEDLKSTKDAVKKKWKALRDVFRVEFKKYPKLKSGEKAPLSFRSKWAYFEQMLFLKEQMMPRKLTGNLTFPEMEETTLNEIDLPEEEDDEQTQINNECETADDVAFTDHESVTDSIPSCSTYVTNTQKAGQPARKAIKRKRESDVNMDSFLSLEKEKKELLKSTASLQDDDNYHFLMSILKPMKEMTTSNNMYFRIKMQALLYECMIPQNSQYYTNL